ncbi:MAG: hypothetical protein P8R04_05345, partial [Gammaproteobacteria bacterium]|nr:hypothetical protein [Gammaproteobacteria bacterium]
MTKSRIKMPWLILGAAFSIFSLSNISLADDTELFLAGEDPDAEGGVQPNIMFIIDTSGSMDTNVSSQLPYDDSFTYSGSCNANLIYVTTTNNAPNCSSSSTSRFPKSSNNCIASLSSLSSGTFFADKMLYWKSSVNKWRTLPNQNWFDHIVDCQDDQRDYGGRTPDGEALNDDKYARNGNNGPYSTQKKNQPKFNQERYLWSGNALNWIESTPADRNRLEIVQEVVTSLLTNLPDVNVGLMRFNFSAGGPVLFDIADLNEGTNRADLITAVNDLEPDGWTPLSETFYEFGQYMYGREVDYGDGREYTSVASSRVGDNINSDFYESPTEFLCQKNYVVYLSDGEPTQDTGAENKIESWIGKSCVNDHNDSDGKCLDELAEYYANEPVISIGGSDGQPINTYTISFAEQLPLMEATAEKGNGKYFEADDAASLTISLTKIATEILDDSTTFTAPAVPVNSFNRTETLSTVYTSLFQPSSTVHWPGNLKRYDFIGGEFVDFNGAPAVDPETGFFKTSAQSYWSADPDGDQVVEGGAALQLPNYDDRKLYTDIAGN